MQKKSIDIKVESTETSLIEIIHVIKRWLTFLQKKVKLIIAIGIIGALVGFSYATITNPTYSATISFAMEDDKGAGSGFGGGAAGIASQLGVDLGSAGGGAFSASNIMELMKSKRIVRNALLEKVASGNNKILLADLYIQIAKKTNAWSGVDKVPDNIFQTTNKNGNLNLTQDSVLQIMHNKIIAQNLSIQQKDKKVSIITLVVKSINQVFSKNLAEVLAQKTSEFYIDTKSKKARINVEILQKQSDSIREKLNEAISGVASSADNVFNLNPAFNLKKTPTTKRQIDVQANTTILTQILANLELSRVTLRKETPLIQIIDSPTLPLEESKPNLPLCLISGFLLFSISFITYEILKQLILDELNKSELL